VVAAVKAAGRPSTTPALVVRNASCAAEVKLVADLDTLVARVAAEGVASPAVVVIGDVVSLPCAAETARWSSRVLV